MSEILIAYFSASGATANLAKTLEKVTGGDLYEMKPADPYTDADLNWNDKKSRSSIEMNDKMIRPAITAIPVMDMTQYRYVFVGFPIWWYEAPRIVQTFLESYDFSDKTVIPFATSGGSGMGKISTILHKSCQTAKMLPGKRLDSNATVDEVSAWVKSLDL